MFIQDNINNIQIFLFLFELEEEKNRENYYFLRHDRHTDQVNYILDPQWYRESSKKKFFLIFNCVKHLVVPNKK